MKISNFNAQSVPETAAAAAPTPQAVAPGVTAGMTPANESREATEVALLRARIEHLELVVETARGLMSANQERLLRRLHDVPQEMMTLTATMTRMAATGSSSAAEPVADAARPAVTRRMT